MPVNGHHLSSHTVFAPSQDGPSHAERTPVTASSEPSAVRPGGLPAARVLTQSVSSLADASSVDGERPRGGGWQDKGALASAPLASAKPASVTESARSSPANTSGVRVAHPSVARERKERASIWMRPGVKSALQRLAKQEDLSFSATCGDALEVFARAKIHDQEETLFEPRMQAMLRREIRASDNRHIYFELRNAIAAEQTRILTTDLYKRQLQKEGVPLKEIEEKLDTAYDMARRNVLKKTPQLKTLLDAWWQGTDEGNSEAEDGKAGRGAAQA